MNQNFQHNKVPYSQREFQKEMIKISDHQLGTKFRSKHDLYQYLTETLHLYMPPKEFVTKDFLKQILKDEKQLLNMEQVKAIKVPRYQELSVKTLMNEAFEDKALKKFFPDIDGKKKTIDRDYFFNILNTIYPNYVKQIIEHAQNIRNAPEMNENKKDYIIISDEWYSKLMSHPYISKKPGKTVQLLKESTKIFKSRKQKEHQELGITLKRFKGMEKSNIQRLKDNLAEEEEEQEIMEHSEINQESQSSTSFNNQTLRFQI